MAGLLIIQSFPEPMNTPTPPPSPWFEEDECNGNPFDREPSEWFLGEDKHYETRDPMDWGDPEERDDELPNPWLGVQREEEEEDSAMEYADEAFVLPLQNERDSDQSDCESVNSIPMSLGSFSTQSSTYEEA